MEIVVHSYLYHVGDYTTHTSHLSLMEDLAYRRLIDLYYLHESPPMGTPMQISRKIRMPKELAAVEQVLNEFFEEELSDSGDNPSQVWRNKRCDEEIQKYQALKEHGRNGAAKRWHKGGDRGAIATPVGSQSEPNANHEPLTMNHEPITTANRSSTRKRVDRPDDVTESVWEAWVDLRKSKKNPVSLVAVNKIRIEASRAGLSLDAALEICCARGWQGFNAEWVEKRDRKEAAMDFLLGRTDADGKRIVEPAPWDVVDEPKRIL